MTDKLAAVKSPIPGTPEWMAPLSRELESVIAQRNLLTTRTRKKVLNDLNSAAVKTEEAEVERLRQRAVEEVLSSERSYLKQLEIVEEFFMRPVKEKNLLPASDFATVFGDLPSIIQVNRELLTALEASEDRIGRVFLELAPYLKFYSTYANDFQSAVKLVEQWTERSKQFRVLVSNQESRPEVKHKLNALLITPIQRVPRYKLLLEDVIKNTPECHPDKASLKEALEQIDAVAWHINEQIREHENSMKMVDIQKSLVGGFPKIVAPGRKLLKQGNLMKVPRTGGSSGQARYFVLFSDMLMYCKIRSNGHNVVGTLLLPKANCLECGCMFPLKMCSVETLMGKGVFKVTCQKEELILYSVDGAQSSQEWVEAISKAVVQHKKDASTLRKESSRRDPLKRPDIMKMRRESLGQILMIRKGDHRHRMALRDRKEGFTSPGNSPLLFSPRKKRPAPPTPVQQGTPAAKVSKKNEEATTPTTTLKMMPPPPSSAPLNVRLRTRLSKRINRPLSAAWKTLSLNRKDQLKRETSKRSVFRSPSIYGDEENQEKPSVMSTYLSGKICPLTPTQQPTNISHLAVKEKPRSDENEPQTPEEKDKEDKEICTAVVPANPLVSVTNNSFCVIM